MLLEKKMSIFIVEQGPYINGKSQSIVALLFTSIDFFNVLFVWVR